MTADKVRNSTEYQSLTSSLFESTLFVYVVACIYYIDFNSAKKISISNKEQYALLDRLNMLRMAGRILDVNTFISASLFFSFAHIGS